MYIIVKSGLVCDGLMLQLVGPGWGSQMHWHHISWRGPEFIVFMLGSHIVEFKMAVLVINVGRREWGSRGGSIQMGVL